MLLGARPARCHHLITVWAPANHDSIGLPTLFWACRLDRSMTHELTKPDAASQVLVDLEGCLCQAEASKEWFDRKVLPLTVKELRWRPAPQAWSIGQYLDHLNLTLALYLPRVNDAIASASPAESATPPLPLGAASEIQTIRL